MKTDVKFWVPNQPVPKARARFRHVKTKDGREFTATYTPKQSVMYETWVRHHASDAWAGREQLTGSVSLDLFFVLERPKSVSEKKRPLPIVKPDLDNLVKSIKDGLKLAGLYKDDCQVCDLTCRKRYAIGESTAGVHVTISG
jgi:Holliday junction resolvase RusA-like endonuclease